MSVYIRTPVVVMLLALTGAARAGVPEPDVRLHGLVKLGGQPVVAGRNVSLVAELAETGSEIGRFKFDGINLTDCNMNGIRDQNEIADGAPDVDGDGILDECNHYVLRMRMEAAVPDEPDNPNAARIGDGVEVYAVDDDDKVCVGGDNPSATCQSDADCTGTDGVADGVCTAGRTLMAKLSITETGVLIALDLGYCDTNNDGIGDLLSSRLYVKSDGPPGGGGVSWATALTDLADAMAARQCAGDFVAEVWVAEGTYTPPAPPPPADPRAATFMIPQGLALYGGFAGTEVSVDERDIAAHPTILSGDLNGDDSTTGTADNAYHVAVLDNLPGTKQFDGFVIEGGNADGAGDSGLGGGLWVRNSSLVIANCVITGNTAQVGGGGVYSNGGAVIWRDCAFVANRTQGDGAGVYNESAIVSFDGCLFEGNQISGGGSGRRGGAVFNNSVGRRRCFGGTADGESCWSADACPVGTCGGVTLTGCDFASNHADVGGAVYNLGSSPVFVGCTFTDNTADQGGAIHNLGAASGLSGSILVNSVLVGNSAGSWGGAICNEAYSASALANCTLSGNASTAGVGGAIGSLDQQDNNNTVTLANCILWGNTAQHGSVADQQFNSAGITANVTYTCVQDDTPGDGAIFPGTGNVDSNPLFVRDPTPEDSGDVHLLVASPCGDAGNNDVDVDPTFNAGIQTLPTTDLAGEVRIADNSCVTDRGAPPAAEQYVDMGAYEFATPAVSGPVLYVDDDAARGHNAASWPDAVDDLQLALCLAEGSGGAIQEIWVAAGTYTPTLRTDGSDPRSASFALVNDVTVYGGFAGTETRLEERNWEDNASILSGDLNRDDTTGGDNSENAYHVLIVRQGTDATAVLDGVTVRDGNADVNQGNKMIGGGMFISDGEPTVVNCTFTDNRAVRGGGLYVLGSSSPRLVGCTISQNHATTHGGGMYAKNGATPMVIGCQFLNNTAELTAGGLRNQDGGTPTLINCLLSGNTKDAVYNSLSSPSIINCTITDNDAFGIRSVSSSSPTITNSIVYANSQGQITGDGIVTYSCVQGGHLGEGNIGDDPLFASAATGDYRLTLASACINAGDNASLVPGIDTDLDDNPRMINAVVHIGAYENQFAGSGDVDGDDDVDLTDFESFAHCLAGPSTTPDPAFPPAAALCVNAFDFDADNDVDLADFARFSQRLTQP